MIEIRSKKEVLFRVLIAFPVLSCLNSEGALYCNMLHMSDLCRVGVLWRGMTVLFYEAFFGSAGSSFGGKFGYFLVFFVKKSLIFSYISVLFCFLMVCVLCNKLQRNCVC